MAEKQVVRMELEVDLHCPDCSKDVKKILGKFPEIRGQVFHKDQNLVKITVECCCPEKFPDKLCRKGRKVIKSIKIVEQPSMPTGKENPTDHPKPPTPDMAPQPPPPLPKPRGTEGATGVPKAGQATTILPPGAALGVPLPKKLYYPFPFGFGCPQCYGASEGTPCDHWYVKLVPPATSNYGDYFGYGYGTLPLGRPAG